MTDIEKVSLEIWNILIRVHGCKPAKEDCSFKKCNHWAKCELLAKALTTWLLECVPDYEMDEDICKCFTPDVFIKAHENIVWCKACDKQHGYKSWNAFRAEMMRRLGGK